MLYEGYPNSPLFTQRRERLLSPAHPRWVRAGLIPSFVVSIGPARQNTSLTHTKRSQLNGKRLSYIISHRLGLTMLGGTL